MKKIHPNSRDAYQAQFLKGSPECFRFRIWNILRAGRASGLRLTDRQIMGILREPDVNNVRPEITRLVQDGLLREFGKVTCEYTKKKVRACAVTELVYFSRGKKPKLEMAPVQKELF